MITAIYTNNRVQATTYKIYKNRYSEFEIETIPPFGHGGVDDHIFQTEAEAVKYLKDICRPFEIIKLY